MCGCSCVRKDAVKEGVVLSVALLPFYETWVRLVSLRTLYLFELRSLFLPQLSAILSIFISNAGDATSAMLDWLRHG